MRGNMDDPLYVTSFIQKYGQAAFDNIASTKEGN